MPADHPTVSVIMPAYNAGKYIATAIESLLRQSFEDWELIIIDDGSTDNTLEIAKEKAGSDSRIRILKMPAPSGSAYQPRKFGIFNARGSLIAPLDADDYIDDNYLSDLLTTMQRTGADAVYPSMYSVSGADITPYLPTDPKLLEEVINGKDCVILTLDGWKIGCNGGIIKKDIYQKVFNLYDSSATYSCADEVLTRQLLFESGEVAFSPTKYYYRKNPESITKKGSIKLFDYIFSNIDIIDFTEEKFSHDSVEYQKAQKQNLNGIIETLRAIDKYNFSITEKTEIFNRLALSQRKIDHSALASEFSSKFLLLSRLPLPILHALIKGYETGRKKLRKIGRIPKKVIDSSLIFLDKMAEVILLSKGKYRPGHIYHEFYDKNYLKSDIRPEKIKEGVICMLDGKIHHGGLTDRLRGILTIYRETKKRKLPFYISWTSPFRLEDYLLPAEVDWRIDSEDIVYEKEYAFPFFNDDETDFHSALRMKFGLKQIRPQIHVYSNADNAKGEYRELFRELFRPSEALKREVESHQEKLGEKYDAYTFRFLQLLGDFRDCNPNILSESEALALIEKCGAELLNLINQPDSASRILVTSDSKRFLDYVGKLDPRIYIVPGEIRHIDFYNNSPDSVWMKTFTDQFLLMGARKVTRMCSGKMYKSGFPRFAAEIGGAKFIEHKF